jgi:hypothetical protein
MKKVSKPLGAGLLIVAVLLMILFVFAQTTPLPSESGDDNFWLCWQVYHPDSHYAPWSFLRCPGNKIPSVTPDGENYHNEEITSDQYYFAALSKHLRDVTRSSGVVKSACCLSPAMRRQSNNWFLVCRSSSGLKATVPF